MFAQSEVTEHFTYTCICVSSWRAYIHADFPRGSQLVLVYIIFLDSTKFKIVWIKITTFFKRRVYQRICCVMELTLPFILQNLTMMYAPPNFYKKSIFRKYRWIPSKAPVQSRLILCLQNQNKTALIGF